MLELCKVCLSIDGQEILHNISLHVGCGERIAIIGPSGCGKTTLLRTAAGLIPPNSGSVYNRAARTAVMFQEPRLLPWLTAEENVCLVLDGTGARAAAREWLMRFDLGSAAQKKPHELSGGMQQRAALARTMAYGGDLILLDEPFRALDTETKRRAADVVSAYTDAALILVTHDTEEAVALSCRTVEFSSLCMN